MSVTGSGKLNKDLDYIASKGLADIADDFSPQTTDSMFEASAESDPDSIGEDTNSPPYSNMPETGLPAASMGGEGNRPQRMKSSLKG